MKALTFLSLIILGLFTDSAAQSDRRNKPETAPTSMPQTQTTQDDSVKAEESVGYSESAPNAPRSISPRQRNAKKPNRDTKKDISKNSSQPSSETSSAQTNSDEEVIKVETSLITIPVSVSNRNGLYIPNLGKENFKVFENGTEQEIAYFGTSEKPFTVVLLIDVSPSTEYKIDEIQAAAFALVDQLKEQDSVMVIQFDERVSVLTEATSDRQKIYLSIFSEYTSRINFMAFRNINQICHKMKL